MTFFVVIFKVKKLYAYVGKPLFILLNLFCITLSSHGQGELPMYVNDASDPASMKSRVVFDAESYFFHNESQFYLARLGFYYGLRNERHLLSLSVPFLHNVFIGDYGGFENTTGIGDIRMMYMNVLFWNRDAIGLERVSSYLEVTAPTGEYQLGRGAGAWLYKPGFIITYRLSPEVIFYPELRFQFSGDDANSYGAGDGLPDTEDPDKEDSFQNLTLQLPVIMQLESWQGWFGLNVQYTKSFSEKTYFLFLRTDVGRMIGPKTSVSLNLSKFVAGQPRLNFVVQARFQFFINSN